MIDLPIINLPMNKLSLRQRITITFMMLTFVICTLFSVGMFSTLQELEYGLFNRFFTEHARWLIHHHLIQPLEQDDLPDIESFYEIDSNDQKSLPSYLQNLKPGWHEVTTEDIGLHVYIEDIGTKRYIVAHDQSEFEQREVVIGTMLFAGVIASLAFAYWASSSIAGQVIKPLSQLAQAIGHQQPIDTNEYSRDEVGNLARAFVLHTNTLEDFLKRERLFTSDVSHELRTPLMSASAAVEVLLTGETDTRRQNTLRRASDSLREMQHLVDAFLALSRHVQVAGSATPIAVAEFIKAEIERLTASSGVESRQQVRRHVICDFTLSASPTLLSVVIGNLLRNAFHYAGDSLITITIDAPQIIIADNGLGISPALIDTVFHGDGRQMPSRDDFAQKVEGHGLGLFIVKRICDHCNWPISVISNERGTRYTLRLANITA